MILSKLDGARLARSWCESGSHSKSQMMRIMMMMMHSDTKYAKLDEHGKDTELLDIATSKIHLKQRVAKFVLT